MDFGLLKLSIGTFGADIGRSKALAQIRQKGCRVSIIKKEIVNLEEHIWCGALSEGYTLQRGYISQLQRSLWTQLGNRKGPMKEVR